MYYNQISIIGSKRFIKQTINALKLIKRKSKKDFNKITKYLKGIKSSKFSYMNLEKAQYNVGKPTAFSKMEWYASTIVHDVHHFYLHNTGKLLWKRINFKKHEELCIKEQIRFLRRIKAPSYLIEHCHNELNGRYWLNKNRNW